MEVGTFNDEARRYRDQCSIFRDADTDPRTNRERALDPR